MKYEAMVLALACAAAAGCSKCRCEKPAAEKSAGTPAAQEAPVAQETPAAEAGQETDEAFVRADGKTTLALFTGSDWCVWCKRLEKEVISTPEFKKALEGKYALEVFDFPNDKSKIDEATAERNGKMRKRYGVQSYPTVIAFDASGKKLCELSYRKGGAAAWLAYAEKEIALSDQIAKYIEPLSKEFAKLDATSFAAFEKVMDKKAGVETLAKPLADMKAFAAKVAAAEVPETLASRKKDLAASAEHVIFALEHVEDAKKPGKGE